MKNVQWSSIYIGYGDWDLVGPETQEDWTLAAAAPELLDAMKLLFDRANKGNIDPFSLQIAASAISKATGETS